MGPSKPSAVSKSGCGYEGRFRAASGGGVEKAAAAALVLGPVRRRRGSEFVQVTCSNSKACDRAPTRDSTADGAAAAGGVDKRQALQHQGARPQVTHPQQQQ